MKNLRNILDKYLLNRMIFKIILIVAMMVTAVPFLHVRVGGYIKFILLYGIAIIGYEFIRGKYRSVLKDKMNIVLLLFCISYFITIIVNRDLNLSDNIKALAYMVVFFILLYMTTEVKKVPEIVKEIEIISRVVVICTFVLSLMSFFTYIFSISGHYWTEQGFIYYGMYENRLWGVYNANTGATLNSISIILSAVFIGKKKFKRSAVFDIMNVVLQFICLTLTSSRGPYYAFLLVVLIASVIVWIRKSSVKKAYNVKKIVCTSICVCLIVIGGMSAFKAITKNVVAYIPSAVKLTGIEFNIAEEGDSESDEDGLKLSKSDLDRLDGSEDSEGGILTSRPDLWQASLKAFKESPIWGITRENLYDKAVKYLENELLAQNMARGGSHNIYICVLVSSGIVGFILLSIFVIYTMVRAISLMIHKFSELNPWMVTSFLFIVMFLVSELVECRILYQVGVFNVLFWIYYGYLGSFSKAMEIEEGQLDAE